MYALISSMSGEIISQHKSLDAAIQAGKNFQKGSRKDTFKPWKIEDSEGKLIAKYGMFEATGYSDK